MPPDVGVLLAVARRHRKHRVGGVVVQRRPPRQRHVELGGVGRDLGRDLGRGIVRGLVRGLGRDLGRDLACGLSWAGLGRSRAGRVRPGGPGRLRRDQRRPDHGGVRRSVPRGSCPRPAVAGLGFAGLGFGRSGFGPGLPGRIGRRAHGVAIAPVRDVPPGGRPAAGRCRPWPWFRPGRSRRDGLWRGQLGRGQLGRGQRRAVVGVPGREVPGPGRRARYRPRRSRAGRPGAWPAASRLRRPRSWRPAAAGAAAKAWTVAAR